MTIQPTAEPPPAPPPAKARSRPMAISVVSGIVAVVAVLFLVLGTVLVTPAAMCGALRPEVLPSLLLGAAPPAACLELGRVMVAEGPTKTLLPTDVLPDGAYFIGLGLVLLLLLFGFRRLRRWGWVGLTAWAGLNLAVSLFRYFIYPERPHVFQFLSLTVNSVIVLALNMEEVQRAFGLRAPPVARPVRNAPPPVTEKP